VPSRCEVGEQSAGPPKLNTNSERLLKRFLGTISMQGERKEKLRYAGTRGDLPAYTDTHVSMYLL